MAAYIRVSTDRDDQENSYETQKRYFDRMLRAHPDWNPVGVYSDYGVSGTVREKRVGFRRLLRHCGEGKIDRIVCKSISRFSRNTADFIMALDTLHQNQVTILFEKENLDTADPTSDFILTTLAAIAQEESRSISRNIGLGNQMRFPRGEVKNVALYGYRFNGRWVTTESGYRYRDIEIVAGEAAVVRRIFQEIAAGIPYIDVARGLNRDGIPAPETPAEKARKEKAKTGQLKSELEQGWTGKGIAQMVQRERYTGAVLVQKKYTMDFLNHKVRRNRGELPQYLVREHHPAIVSEELFAQIREARQRNAANRKKAQKPVKRPFSGRLLCGECGRFFWVKNAGTAPLWFCPTAENQNGIQLCHAEKLPEAQIVQAFRQAVLERFGPLGQSMETGMNVEEILHREEDADAFSGKAESFVPRMLRSLESCGETPEADYAWREQAIEWMQALPKGRDGAAQFLRGATTEYCPAFVRSITVHSSRRYTFRWFDNTQTEITL